MRYRVLLWLAVLVFLTTLTIGTVAVYRSYRHCRAMEEQQRRKMEEYREMKNRFEIQEEHVKELAEDSDFVEQVARERIQIAGENEMLFRFE
ncbi:MAG: septum formation initiator family protein [Puniceicoccales bacterium]|jgi:cell division protein FtsB|nr:septum formation initiator family protein [Puniceicoccales bacterium]